MKDENRIKGIFMKYGKGEHMKMGRANNFYEAYPFLNI
jgi:hypothetical protein